MKELASLPELGMALVKLLLNRGASALNELLRASEELK